MNFSKALCKLKAGSKITLRDEGYIAICEDGMPRLYTAFHQKCGIWNPCIKEIMSNEWRVVL